MEQHRLYFGSYRWRKTSVPSIFVIGGARRLGAAISKAVASLGLDVGVTWNSSEQKAQETANSVRKNGVACALARADVIKPAELVAALDALARELGVPEAIIVNAGTFPEPMAIADVTEAHVLETLQVNTLPIVSVAQWYYANAVDRTTPGRLISIGSLGAEQIWKDRLAYNVSKAALATAVRSLARSCAPYLAVNTVAPGMIIIPDEPSPNDASAAPVSAIPMGRYGSVDDVIDAVTFFVKASPYITGQTLRIDGGHNLTRNV
jgi:NAD(P)-dependent dehydrogenase (short-subunit alcohol dehydrogenase family)